MHIDIQAISKTFGTFTALDDVSLRIGSGELVALLGPSGSGKTTLLRIIAGLEHPDVGRVCFNGDDATQRSLRERRVGFVFQHYALFRHLSVFENVAFGLRVRPRAARPPEAEIRRRVTELLELVQLAGLGNRLPTQLSGGQRQRVALARALAVEPQVLLLDEPFGALDAKVRRELRRWLRRLHDELGITSIFVTHDQEEALELADRVVIMNHGRVEQEGTPDDVYTGPGSAFVYHFLGDTNHVPGEGRDGQVFIGGLPLDAGVETNGPVDVFVRPHGVMVNAFSTGQGVPARVHTMSAAGPLVRVEFEAGALGNIRGEITHDRCRYLGVKVGLQFRVWFDPGQVFVASGAARQPSTSPLDEDEEAGRVPVHPVAIPTQPAQGGRVVPMFGKAKVS